jgi:hypothetical protein
MNFLEGTKHTKRPLAIDVKTLTPISLFLGKGNQGLEIAVLESERKPTSSVLQEAFGRRRSGRAAPVLILVLFGNEVALCGVTGDKPPSFFCKDLNQVERICSSALDSPDRNSVIRFLGDALPTLETPLPGISNRGLLSIHELSHGVRDREDWANAVNLSKKLLGRSGDDLISALGFKSRRLDNLTDLLIDDDKRTALAVLLREDEVPEVGTARFNNVSPVSYAITKADNENLPWVLLVQEDRVRVYNTQNIGVGRRGRTETYVECQPSIMSSEDIGLLWLLFSAEALKESGTLGAILEDSKRFAASVADKLRERIYDTVVPELAMGIAKAQNILRPTKSSLALTYEMALLILFRLLFIAYAEDRELLPYKSNEAYRRRSLKNKAIELSNAASQGKLISSGEHHWKEIASLCKAVYDGNSALGIPAYAGAIFSEDSDISEAGAALADITLDNQAFEAALRALLLTEAEERDFAPVDFRSLSVREFGTIYEGLLESELSVAEQDLTSNKKGIYIPATNDEEIFVKKGEVFLHDKSGARKSSGSFYTPDFAVEHLLDEALEPAIDEHLANLKSLGEAERAERFFDFRVADIAMGSGHFLIAAIDRIEHRFVGWLEENHIPGVIRELQYLKSAAKKELGELAEGVNIEDGQLMRRMIARRCIYGVDLNSIAVQLTRLSVWIHTFVPGLPLSLLDHNLIQGNALVGVGCLEEIRSKFGEASGTLFEVDADALLGQASEPLLKLAKLSDATIKDINIGRELMDEAEQKIDETKALCDLIIAQPVTDDQKLRGFAFENWEQRREEIFDSSELISAKKILDPFSTVHFPIAFPEVFLGRAEGFNVILGNPPWEELKPEERDFWTSNFPGLRSLPQREQVQKWKELSDTRPDLMEKWEQIENLSSVLASIIKTGNYPGLETGDLDLYKAFCWRFWDLTSNLIGKIGVVLPRSVLAAKGSEKFRKELFIRSKSLDITSLQNTGQWIFDIHPQYTIVLASISKSEVKENGLRIRGPYNSMQRFKAGSNEDAIQFSAAEVIGWSDNAALPLLPYQKSAQVFRQLKQAPRLDLNIEGHWRARPDTQLHATAQKPLMDLDSKECPKGFWPVYKGGSFDLWKPDTGQYYAWADPGLVLPWLQSKRVRAKESSRDSVHKEYPLEYLLEESTLAPLSPQIAFRLITRATDTRTMRVALVPPNTVHANSSQIIMMSRGDEKDAAFLLGVLSSIPLDWLARRFVEINFNFFLLNPLPIPRPNRDSILWKRAVKLSGRLASVDERFSKWADAVNVEFGLLEENIKQNYIEELDAVVAHLYELSESDLAHIYETFHEGWDYKPRLTRVMQHYHHWNKK